jgi:hypothetical protein
MDWDDPYWENPYVVAIPAGTPEELFWIRLQDPHPEPLPPGSSEPIA